jgi:formylglycine-generating enzyme required for sulfatase activity
MEYMYENQVATVTGTLSDFYICPVEVTNKLWDGVMGWRPEGQSNNGDSYPVSNVNYYDIVKEGGFIDKLNTMCADQLPSGKRFALPTEAQWEYAACGGQKSMGHKYAGSNTIDEVAWYAGNADGTTHPVGLKQPNELGLYEPRELRGNAQSDRPALRLAAPVHREPTGLQERRTATAQIEISDDQTRLII